MTHSKTTKILTLSVLALGIFALSACETIGGAGRDIENAGEAVQDASN